MTEHEVHSPTGPTPGSVGVFTPTEPTEYEQFEQLAKKLVAVPKSEIDAERAKKA